MTREEFRKLTEEGLLLLDGGMGSNLQKQGMPAGVCPDRWEAEHPETVISIQTEYLKAGSRILYSPTFSCNRIKLSEYGLEGEIAELNRKLVGLSREAIRRFKESNPDAPECYVAGDVSMTGLQVKPVGPLDFEELIGIYSEQIRYLAEGGADLIIVETMMSLQETRAAVIAAKETCSLPVMASMTFEADGHSLFGTDAKTALITLQSLGVDAFGANCSTGPDQMLELIRGILPYAKVPVLCKPNAGLPKLDGQGNTCYDMLPEEFGEGVRKLAEAGAGIIGGCCGTDGSYLRRVKEEIKELKKVDIKQNSLRCLTSERRTLEFGLKDPFLIIGERINPTGKKALQAELREGEFDMVLDLASEQEENGASILDINMGMSGVDEKALMLDAIDQVTMQTDLPLSIDTSYPEVMEAALRRYPGRALMNSVSAESGRCERMLEIAKKYGAMFILLPLGDTGLPKDQEEKKRNIRYVLDKALAMGFAREDIVVDGLVGTVGAVKSAALDTLDTIRYCRELGLATVCGLSNISFGLPERIHVNTAFLTMAIRDGLTMAICNPNQEAIVAAAKTSDLLTNKPGADISYIDYMNEHGDALKPSKASGAGSAPGSSGGSKASPEKAGASKASAEEDSPLSRVREAVIRGKKKTAAELTDAALKAGIRPQDILDRALIPAINEVGEFFDKGTYFLPQLIASAETMELSIKRIEPLLQTGEGAADAPAIIIATVEGDVHDIGKNLVTLMLKNYGFKVFDLGKNVPKEEIVRSAMEHGADIICLSALMTTTMKEMGRVISYAREQGCRARFMIGGAVITEDYRKEIGADGYAADAAEAVKVARRLMEEKKEEE